MVDKNKTGGTTSEMGNEMRSSPPLLSWDIFMSSYWRKAELLEDAKSIYDLSKKFRWKHNWDFREELLFENKIIIVTTNTLEIVTASSNITEMNGYESGEIIGKYPSMFQGIETQETSKQVIRKAINELRPFETNIINYHKRGHTYNCHIQGCPIFNMNNELTHFIAFEKIA